MRAASAVLIAVLSVSGAQAEEPLSAIDWLSKSVSTLPETETPKEGIVTGEIAVSTLDDPVAEAAGLLAPSVTGLPRDLWGPASTDSLAREIAAIPPDLSPALSRLFLTLLLAEADAPAAGSNEDSLLLARVDRLLETGDLDRATALLERAGLSTGPRFRRYFDVSLLRGTEQEACRIMAERPNISPTFPARIFCLARSGDWNAAALTLDTASSLGILSPEEDVLLARFLDPDVAEAPVPGRTQITPLNLRLLEAIGEPVPASGLPIAFAWSELRAELGWKARIGAAERLARHGALSPNLLLGIYLRQRPSASGGVWDRVEAVQALEEAMETGDLKGVARSLPEADTRLSAVGLRSVLAALYGPRVAALPLTGKARTVALSLGLLSDDYEAVARAANPAEVPDRFVLAVALGKPETAVPSGPVATAVRRGFEAGTLSPDYARLIDDGRIGEAVLRAIRQLSDSASGEIDALGNALAALRSLGLEDHARRASLDLLLADSLG